eukprot:m.3368 g.3368  ORF g.3368 m.3368 type:complete len:68 (+) comp4036_c0_seq1:62-265(+)
MLANMTLLPLSASVACSSDLFPSTPSLATQLPIHWPSLFVLFLLIQLVIGFSPTNAPAHAYTHSDLQ